MDGEDAGDRMSTRGERCGVVVGVEEDFPRWETGVEEVAVYVRSAMVTTTRAEVW